MGFDKAKAVSAAEKFLAQGKIPAAIQEYRRIVEADTGDFTALNTLGDLYARTNNPQEAIACFARVADHYREQGFALKAIAMYKKVARLNPNAPNVNINLATLYEQQGLIVEARQQYMLLADAYTRTGQVRDALEALRRIADLDPQNIDIRLRLAEGFLRENMHDDAADAYAEAGASLMVRGDVQGSLEAYGQAVELRPFSHAFLQGLVAAHMKLGQARAAAEALEQALERTPDDLELRAMLAHAYIAAEDAQAADSTVSGLLSAEPSSYALLFEVARLYLQQNDVDRAVHALDRTIEPAMAGRQEAILLELLDEVLAQEPEHMDALRLLTRVYTWQRDDERMRVALERLAEAAHTRGLVEEEKRALENLVRLVPLDQSYHERLYQLGGTPPGADDAEEATPIATLGDEVPSFESVLGESEQFMVTATPEPADAVEDIGAFEWNTIPEEPAPTADPNASFADLSDNFAASITDSSNSAFGTEDLSGAIVSPMSSSERATVLLEQELESVDYYLAQGYTDIARDTLEMLERQYGEQPKIIERRQQLQAQQKSAPVADKSSSSSPQSAPADAVEPTVAFDDFASFDLAGDSLGGIAADADLAEHTFVEQSQTASATVSTEKKKRAKSKQKVKEASPSGALDPGLAAVFDEFRQAVETDSAPSSEEDYETHYNLGLAYKDMDLMDEAIEEFQAAIALVEPEDETPRYLQCCNLLGHCFMQKGMFSAAAMWFKKGLAAPGHTEDEYQALRYELGTAYEQMGDLDHALEIFSEVYGIDVSYRGVAGKLRDLQAKKEVTTNSKP